MSNRLARATSPYLQQHRDNPVHWFEWGDEAFAEARERDVPVFLSVGYSACHWCHVMAHESFEDETTAAFLNQHFVSVKVDREERPDIDAVYMEVTQAMTGQGGWPMTCILTPDGEPFFAGTYYPREPRQGMPAFTQVLQAIVTAWRERRDEVTQIGSDVIAHLRGVNKVERSESDDIGAAAVAVLKRTFDESYAGFGGAPKFPPSMVCEFLLRRAARLDDREALRMAERTLEAMARGGLFDQLGGGFARYSVDGRWDVPHFEKMLYDNALLLRVYVHWFRQSANPLAERVARETADFMLRELRTPEHGFASALDADSDGREGTFYVWSRQELVDLLGPDEGESVADLFGVGETGNFEDDASTLRLDVDPPHRGDFADLQRRLLDARAKRTRPARDDKVVAAWNGLAISALAEAGAILEEPRYVEVAEAVGELLASTHFDENGQLRRVSRDGTVGEPLGVLEDYACVAESFLTLFGVTGADSWFEQACGLLSQIEDRFSDGEGGFFDTAVDSPALLKRPQDPADNATPSGQAMTASVLVTMAGLTGDDRFREAATRLLATMSGLAEHAPRFAGQSLAVLEALLDGPRQVAVVGADGDLARDALVKAAYRLPYPGLVVAQGAPGDVTVPLLDDRRLVRGQAAAYLCRQFVCELPVTDPKGLR